MQRSPSFSILTCKLCQLRLSYQLSSSVQWAKWNIATFSTSLQSGAERPEGNLSQFRFACKFTDCIFWRLITHTNQGENKTATTTTKKTLYQKSTLLLFSQNLHTRTGFSLFKRIISKTKSEYNGRIPTCLLSSLTAFFIIRVSLLQHIIIIRSCAQWEFKQVQRRKNGTGDKTQGYASGADFLPGELSLFQFSIFKEWILLKMSPTQHNYAK